MDPRYRCFGADVWWRRILGSPSRSLVRICQVVRIERPPHASPGRFSPDVRPTTSRGLLQTRRDKACSGPPRGYLPPPPPPSLASLGERAKVAPRGWLHVISMTSNIRRAATRSVDLVAATASCILLAGFVCALVALWDH